ncbi:cation diffusion facilitator family transporter [Saccharibacillus sp. WB 17]|nr:cation transporter [Saccharibacillus sp. WB 17]
MAVRQQQGGKASGWTDACILGAAALIKGIGGWMGGSPALLADALNSASDAVRSPRGGKGLSVPVVRILFAALILVGAIEVSISGFDDLAAGVPQSPGARAFAAFFVAVIVGQGLFVHRYRRLAAQDRPAARRFAAEHRFSLYASMVVAAGMALSITGSLYDMPQLMYADSAASIAVAFVAIVKALRLMLRVLEESPAAVKKVEENPKPFVETVQRVRGVIEVRELKAVRSLETVRIELVLSVNPRMTVKEAEEIAQRSRDLLMHRFVQVIEVDVRVEPYHTGYPYKSNEELLSSGEEPTIVQ